MISVNDNVKNSCSLLLPLSEDRLDILTKKSLLVFRIIREQINENRIIN